ncbi:MAG: acyl-CoA thioesterase [Leptothrix sp. (in: Bacteria)]|nr:acyl-CoA thioesterase [Leptothrix sp. (in: b-proteobacteria)]
MQNHAMTMIETWDHAGPHVLPVCVQDAHTDLMRHTNNVVYLQWVEDVAWAHSNALGLGPEHYQACGHGLVVRQHELNYLAATRLGDELLLGTWITQIDKLSLYRQFQFIRSGDGQTVFRARTHYVCVDIAQGRVRRMPLEFTQTYSAALVPGAPAA